MVVYGGLLVTRQDTITLAPGELISSLVLDAWSTLLNELIYQKLSSNEPSRVYMGLTQNVSYFLKQEVY